MVSVSITATGTSASASPLAQAPVLVQGVVGLREGAVGADVTSVQQALISAGVNVAGGADGRFGAATRSALVEFQVLRGLPQSGEVDDATAAALGLPTVAALVVADAVSGLQVGATGDAVTELQEKLAASGVYVGGGVDGRFGAATTTAVRQYQRWNGLAATGTVDQATSSRLGLTGTPVAATPVAPVAPAASSAGSNSYVGLSIGARGDLVKGLQNALIAAGVSLPGGADGVFGSGTRAALTQYQQSNGLGVSGVVFRATAVKLGLGSGGATPVAAAPPAAGNSMVGLATGARGDMVKQLQAALIGAGIAVRGGADGVFGEVTKAALIQYQQAKGLGASGTVDAATSDSFASGAAPVAPAPASANPYVGMSVGAKGQLVKDLQTALVGTGLALRGGSDGVFGNATKSALIAFQSVNGIPTNGVVSEKGAGILNLGASGGAPAPASGFAGTPAGFATKGESSERARQLQQLLIDWKIPLVGGADGSFGNATAAAITKFQQANGLTVTGSVTQQTADKLGLKVSSPSAPAAAGSVQLTRFPLQGRCYYGNTWQAARGSGRTHEGVDMIASEGTLIYAVVDGTITKQYWDTPGALAGNGLRVAQDNGTYFTYLHMSGVAPGVAVGTKVKAGDVIGFVGNTGSSATAHLHFEIHPNGGAAVNPYPYVKAIDDCGNTTPRYQSSFGG